MGFAVAISVLAGMELNHNITAVPFSRALFIIGGYGAAIMHARTLMVTVGVFIGRFVQLLCADEFNPVFYSGLLLIQLVRSNRAIS
jgi:hypothetical protein